MDHIHKRVQGGLHSCNTTFVEDVESGGPIGVQGSSEKGVDRLVLDLNAGMGGSASTKEGGTPEI